MNSALHHITILLLLQLKMATLYKVLCSLLPEAKDETLLDEIISGIHGVESCYPQQ